MWKAYIKRKGADFQTLRDLIKEMYDNIQLGEIGHYLDEMEASLGNEEVIDELENLQIKGTVEDLYEHILKLEELIMKTHRLFNQQSDEI